MAFWRTLGRVTGIYAVMHVTRLVGDGVNYILGGDESQKKNKNLERKLRLEQMKYIQASNFTVDQQQALKKIIGGQEIEYALQEEQDELQRKLQTAIYELDNRNKVKKYADNRMTNNIKNRTEYFPKKARRIHQTYYWDTQDIEGKSLRIEQLDFSQKQTYDAICPWDWSQYDMRENIRQEQNNNRKSRSKRSQAYRRAYQMNPNLREVA